MSEDEGGPHARDLLGWEGRSAAPALLRLRARAQERYPLRDVLVSLVDARRPLRITLPADPDAPLDAMAAHFKQLKASKAARNGLTGGPDVLCSDPGLTPALWAEPAPQGQARERSQESGESRTERPRPQRGGGQGERSATRDAARDAAESASRVLATGAHLPYWALLWPSGQALAEALVACPEAVAGRRVLELGSGLGVTAATTLALGADLWAADCFPDALLFTAINCLGNAGRRPRPLLLDWRTAAGRAACRALAPFDVVLAADVLYEAEDEAPLLDLIPSLLRDDGVFWLAEPGRRVSREFVTRALAAGWRDEAIEVAHSWPLEREAVRVGVHRFTHPGREGVH